MLAPFLAHPVACAMPCGTLVFLLSRKSHARHLSIFLDDFGLLFPALWPNSCVFLTFVPFKTLDCSSMVWMWPTRN